MFWISFLPCIEWVQGEFPFQPKRVKYTLMHLQACFEVSDVNLNVKNTGMSAVRSVLGTFTYDQVC
jgi:hypothetical protein